MSVLSVSSQQNGVNFLFENPFSKQAPLLKKIACVFFHALTLCIPLIIYHSVRYVFYVPGYPTYSKIGQDALAFARQLLSENPDVKPARFYTFADKTHQPNNPEISKLTTLYWKYYKDFESLLQKHNADPWKQEEVLQAADKQMKIAFAISALTLQDLGPFTKKLASDGHPRTYAKALSKQDSYQYRTFFYGTDFYHVIRCGGVWEEDIRRPGKGDLVTPRGGAPKWHEAAFYKKGTRQHAWRELYNDFCNSVYQTVSKRELYRADSRHVNWTKPDTGPRSFRAVPDTMPT